MNLKRSFGLAFASMLLGIPIGCAVSVDKDKNGQEKNVKVETPFGGVHVNSDDTNAADIGLPIYPGAQPSAKKDGDKSADIRVGFGEWQFRLKVAKYQTLDSPDKVVAFYKKALGRYGDVLQCNGPNPVGSPTITREGLTCDDSQNHREVKFDGSQSLRAGSKRHQHIMGIEKNSGDMTTFSLVELDLPAVSSDGGKVESN